MRYIILILQIFFLLVVPKVYAQQIYSIPKSNSIYNNPETKIVLTFLDKIISEDNFEELIEVEGSLSGKIPFHAKVCNANRTLILDPLVDFKLGEKIEVKVSNISGLEYSSLTDFLPLVFYIKESNNEVKKQREVSSFSKNGFPEITVNVNNKPADGKVFFHNLSALATDNDRYYGIMNNDGSSFYSVQDNNRGLGFTLQKNGYLSYWDSKSFLMMDSTYTVVDTFKCGNGYEADWHEFQITEDGHAFLLAWDVQVVDMSQLIAGGQQFASVEGLVIQELDEDKNVIFEWKSWDHFEILDAEDVDFTTSYISYVHGNSLDIDSDGNLLLSSRLMNEITKIDRTTGDIIWRLGGKNNEFTFTNDDGFCRQHDFRRIANGNITLYDNGECHTPQISRAVEYEIDEDNKSVTRVWEYKHPKEIYCETMGSVQRLKNGNTFINWGRIPDANMSGDNLFPAITEVSSDGTIVYEVTFDKFFHMLYRSYRFDWDVPITSIEDDLIKEEDQGVTVYPNPAVNYLDISFEYAGNDVMISLYNSIGQLVKSERNSAVDNGTARIDLTGIEQGIYFCLIDIDGQKYTRKVLISRR